MWECLGPPNGGTPDVKYMFSKGGAMAMFLWCWQEKNRFSHFWLLGGESGAELFDMNRKEDVPWKDQIPLAHRRCSPACAGADPDWQSPPCRQRYWLSPPHGLHAQGAPESTGLFQPRAACRHSRSVQPWAPIASEPLRLQFMRNPRTPVSAGWSATATPTTTAQTDWRR